MLGIFVVIVGIIFICLFEPDKDPIEAGSVSEEGSLAVILTFGLLGAFGLAVEMIIANKHPTIGCGMDVKHATTFQYCYLFVEGAIGTVCLIVTTSLGGGLYEMSAYTILAMMLCALNIYWCLVLLGYSIRIGVAGVVVSIFNTNIPLHTAISSFALH